MDMHDIISIPIDAIHHIVFPFGADVPDLLGTE